MLETGDFDLGHEGKTLADFVNHEYSRLAQLLRPHVLALRMYTSSSYPCFNKPLRDRQKPHPFAMSVYYLADALKKLRAVGARSARTSTPRSSRSGSSCGAACRTSRSTRASS